VALNDPPEAMEPSGKAEWRSISGALLLGHCKACGEVHYYPRVSCPFCFSFEVDRVESAGKGSIYSLSYTPRGPKGPYVIAYVTLDEGVSLLTNIIGAAPESLSIGVRVEVAFREEDGVWIPYFTPA
jgi:uncharacterized OB-fold protein